MKSIIITVQLFILSFIATPLLADQFTFHTAGLFSNSDNWDIYPGIDLTADDTLYITADCFSIEFDQFEGRMEVSGNVGVLDFLVASFHIDSSLKIDVSDFLLYITIFGELEFDGTFENPNSNILIVANEGNGLTIGSDMDIQEYINAGTHSGGTYGIPIFTNPGTLEISDLNFVVDSGIFDLECGTITGASPYNIEFLGDVQQTFSSCTPKIENVLEVKFNEQTDIKYLQIIKPE